MCNVLILLWTQLKAKYFQNFFNLLQHQKHVKTNHNEKNPKTDFTLN